MALSKEEKLEIQGLMEKAFFVINKTECIIREIGKMISLMEMDNKVMKMEAIIKENL